jgi:hypothetical protein
MRKSSQLTPYSRVLLQEASMKSERLSANIELIPHRTLIRSTMTCLHSWEFGENMCFEIAARAKQDSLHDWQLPKAHADPLFACGCRNSETVTCLQHRTR